MANPKNLKYAESHEWTLDNGDGTVTIGITDFAQEALGDVVYIEMPEVGDGLDAGDTFGVVESVKAASDLYAPVTGEVIEVNVDLEDSPETINSSPFEDGWIMKIKMEDSSELDNLLDAAGYNEAITES